MNPETLSSVISFIVSAFAFLLTIGFSGFISAYINYFLNDRQSIEEGYGTLNPFFHLDTFSVVVFLVFRVIIRRNQPFDWDFNYGMKGFFEKLFYIVTPYFIHLMIAFLSLAVALKIWGGTFLGLSLSFNAIKAEKLILCLKSLFVGRSPVSIIFCLFFLHFISINIFISLFELFSRSINFMMHMYILPYYRGDSMLLILLPTILLVGIFILFEPILWKTSWNIILFLFSYSLPVAD